MPTLRDNEIQFAEELKALCQKWGVVLNPEKGSIVTKEVCREQRGTQLDGYRVSPCWLVNDGVDTDRYPDWWEIKAVMSTVTER